MGGRTRRLHTLPATRPCHAPSSVPTCRAIDTHRRQQGRVPCAYPFSRRRSCVPLKARESPGTLTHNPHPHIPPLRPGDSIESSNGAAESGPWRNSRDDKDVHAASVPLTACVNQRRIPLVTATGSRNSQAAEKSGSFSRTWNARLCTPAPLPSRLLPRRTLDRFSHMVYAGERVDTWLPRSLGKLGVF